MHAERTDSVAHLLINFFHIHVIPVRLHPEDEKCRNVETLAVKLAGCRSEKATWRKGAKTLHCVVFCIRHGEATMRKSDHVCLNLENFRLSF